VPIVPYLRHHLPPRGHRPTRALPALVLLLVTLAGCGPSTSSTDKSTAQTPDPQLCREIRSLPAPTAGRRLAVVVDLTTSVRPRPLAPALLDRIAKLQANSALEVFGVNGNGGDVPRLPAIALDPMPGDDSTDGNDARGLALRCLPGWLADPVLQPTTPGSDIAAAFNAAARQHPELIGVSSDGVATTGGVTLDGVGLDDPRPAINDLADGGAIAPLAGISVLWTDAGEARPPLPEPVRGQIVDMWTQLLTRAKAKKVEFSSVTGSSAEAGVVLGRADGPADDWTPPEPPPPGQDIPSSLLFRPGSAQLSPEADAVLRPIAKRLAADPTLRARIAAHCADFGSRKYQLAMTRRRGANVLHRLDVLGAAPSQLKSVSFGSTRPIANEWPDGRSGKHDLAAAAKNRRVAIDLVSRG
jgi:outer membrane protein OmpA-like peptidoglycan-associated protein